MAGLVLLGGTLVMTSERAPVPAPSYVAAVSETAASVTDAEMRLALAKGKGKGKGKHKGQNGASSTGAGFRANGPGKRRGKRGKGAADAMAPDAAGAPDAPPRTLPDPPPLPTQYTAVAVLPVQAYDVPEEVQGTVEQAVVDEIDQLNGLRAVTPGDLQSDLNAVGLSISECDRDLECLARAGRYGRSHLVVETRVSALAGADAIALRIIDTVKSQEVTRVAEPLAGDTQAQALQLHRLITQLLNPDAYEGNISFLCDVDGAEIYLDDKLLGTSPLPSQDHLRAGVHILRVSKVGYTDVNRFVDVVLNRSSTIQVNLNTSTVSGVIVEMRSSKGFGSLFAVSQDAGWDIRVDGEPLGMMPLSAPIDKIPVGTHHITMKKPGQQAVAFDVDVKADQRTSFLLNITDKGPVFVQGPTEDPAKDLPTIDTILHPPLPPAPPPPPLVETHTFPTWRTWTAIGVGGAGVVGLGLSGFFGHQVQNFNNEAANDEYLLNHAGDANVAGSPTSLTNYTTLQNALDKVNADGAAAERNEWITLGVGGALVATGAGFLIWDLLHTEMLPATSMPVSAQPAPVDGASPTTPAPAPAAPPAPKTSWWLGPLYQRGGAGLQAKMTW